jgi:hypothetical protein
MKAEENQLVIANQRASEMKRIDNEHYFRMLEKKIQFDKDNREMELKEFQAKREHERLDREQNRLDEKTRREQERIDFIIKFVMCIIFVIEWESRVARKSLFNAFKWEIF